MGNALCNGLWWDSVRRSLEGPRTRIGREFHGQRIFSNLLQVRVVLIFAPLASGVLAGIAISRNLPMLVELTIATDGSIIVFIMGVLTRAVQKHAGTTAVGALATLREVAAEPARQAEEVIAK